MIKCRASLALLISLILMSCATTHPNTVTQVSTINALLAGVYDGQQTCGRMLRHGDLGLGTFDALDGEMVVLDGAVYRVRSDGQVCRVRRSEKTPFAAVVDFIPQESQAVTTPKDMAEIEGLINELTPNTNLVVAVRIRGDFETMKTRSVPAQTKPYPPLAEVAKEQSVFEFQNVTGTIVGFRCPAYLSGVNVPGYHLHFLSDDKMKGGHILGFTMLRGTVEADPTHRFVLMLPEGDTAFAVADLEKDRTHELEQVEK